MGARTDAAREEVLAARVGLEDEVGRLRASARDAVDVRAKVRRNPGKAAAAAAGTAFVVAGGPKRVLRAVKRRVRGTPDPLPASLLPEEVEKAVAALGDDGTKVRGALERGFTRYLGATAKDRKAEERQRSFVNLAMRLGTPVATRLAKEAARRAFPESEGRAQGPAKDRPAGR